MTVLDNVMLGGELQTSRFFGRLFGERRTAAKAAAMALLAEVGLTGHEHKYPAALSGGMQQRLALAQALMCKPKVLLLDEPFGALDPGIRAEIHVLIRRIWNASNLTVVMVTHDLSEAFRLATRVIAFERPRKRPEELERYGATLSGDLKIETDVKPAPAQGAQITRDIEIWPPRVAGAPVPETEKPAS